MATAYKRFPHLLSPHSQVATRDNGDQVMPGSSSTLALDVIRPEWPLNRARAGMQFELFNLKLCTCRRYMSKFRLKTEVDCRFGLSQWRNHELFCAVHGP